jgi:flagellar motor switch protein FliN/FliY
MSSENERSAVPADAPETEAASVGSDEFQRAAMEALEESAAPSGSGQNMDVVLDIPVQVSMELGRTRLSIRDLLQLGEGSVIRLERAPGDPLDIFVNGCLVARGEVVVLNDRMGMRVTDIVSPDERVRRLR